MLSQSPYKKYIWAALPLFVVTAWFSVGYNHPDEHFQVLEFCFYKLGLVEAKDLPWEFAAQCRTSVHPFLAYCICKGLFTLGIFNPVWAAFLMRLMAGLLSWWVTAKLVVKLLPKFSTDLGKKLFVGCSFFLWFVPYLGVRFSAENLSASLFLLAVMWIVDLNENQGLKKYALPLLAGCVMGFVFFTRLQMAFAMVGLGIWMIFYQKTSLRNWVLLILGASVAVVASLAADHWMYGKWLFTPYLYFHTNIVQHVAEKWGVFPWYYYIVLFVQMAIPPISIVLPFFFIRGLRKNLTDVFVLITLAFLAGHFAIGHKEMRFLYPLSFAFIYITALGLDNWLNGRVLTSLQLGVGKFLVVFNLLILTYRTFAPAQEAMLYFNYIYRHANVQPTRFVYWGRSPYGLSILEANFYKNPSLQLVKTETIREFDSVVSHNPSGTELLYLSRSIIPEPETEDCRLQKVYCIYPDWLLRFNIGNWEDRSNIWTIYKISPKMDVKTP